jgi:hypothetical protein
MQTISEKIVERTWKKMARMPLHQVPQLIEHMKKEQPEIFVFLLAAGYDDFNQAEKEWQLYLGTIIWQIMQQGTSKPKRVSEERLDQCIERMEKMAEYLMGESENDFETTIIQIFQDYNQINVLRYVVEVLFEDEEIAESEIRDEMKGLILLNLKTVIEALDQ